MRGIHPSSSLLVGWGTKYFVWFQEVRSEFVCDIIVSTPEFRCKILVSRSEFQCKMIVLRSVFLKLLFCEIMKCNIRCMGKYMVYVEGGGGGITKSFGARMRRGWGGESQNSNALYISKLYTPAC